jgi:hypothetical protein
MATVATARQHESRDPKASVQHVEDVTLASDKLRDFETEALVVMGPKADFKLQTIILDEIRDDEVLVEMKYSGICMFSEVHLCRSNQLIALRSYRHRVATRVVAHGRLSCNFWPRRCRSRQRHWLESPEQIAQSRRCSASFIQYMRYM